MSSREVIESVWDTTNDNSGESIHQLTGNAVESVMKCSLMRRTLDNITVAIIGFKNFKRTIFSKKVRTEESIRDHADSFEKTTIIQEVKRPLTASVYVSKPRNEIDIRPETPKYPLNSNNLGLAKSLVVSRGNFNYNNMNKSSLQQDPPTSAHPFNSKQKTYNIDGILNQKLNFKKKPYENEGISFTNNNVKLGMSRSQEFKGF